MEESAFALLDCLGFKGIWNRVASSVTPEQIVKFLEETKANVHLLPTLQIHEIAGELEFSFAFVSDSVAVSARLKNAKPASDYQRGFLVSAAGQACRDIVQRFAKGPTPITMRGNISYGENVIRDSFFVGPAVDEAASLAEAAQGAFVWASPEAQRLHRVYQSYTQEQLPKRLADLPSDDQVLMVDGLVKSLDFISVTFTKEQAQKLTQWWHGLDAVRRRAVAPTIIKVSSRLFRPDSVLEDYPMHLNTGGVIRADLLNPLFGIELAQHRSIIEAMVSSFRGPTLDVLMKKQRTEEFLAEASRRTRIAVDQAVAKTMASVPELSKLAGSPLGLRP
jgi:hypothetical protein